MLKSMKFIGGAALAVVFTTSAHAELDPELAQATIKNESGFFLGGGLKVGQAYSTAGSTPGVGLLGSIEPGWVATRGSWGRIEASFELGAGQLSWRDKGGAKASNKADINTFGMAKVGYGWSIGESMFSILRLGAGIALLDFSSEVDVDGSNTDANASGLSGQMGHIAYDLLFPMGDAFDLIGGISLTHIAFDVDKVEVSGNEVDVDEATNLNLPALSLGARWTF